MINEYNFIQIRISESFVYSKHLVIQIDIEKESELISAENDHMSGQPNVRLSLFVAILVVFSFGTMVFSQFNGVAPEDDELFTDGNDDKDGDLAGYPSFGSTGYFSANHGQLSNDDVLFTFNSDSYSVGFLSSGYLINARDGPSSGHMVSVTFSGSNPTIPSPGNELPGKQNYLLGSDPSQWHIGVPTYDSIMYTDLYPGIDAIFTITIDNELKYDFIVHPGSDPSVIALSYEGANEIFVDSEGLLHVVLPGSEMVEEVPEVYQPSPDVHQSSSSPSISPLPPAAPGSLGNRNVDCSLVVQDGTVRFDVDEYDQTSPLIIDPLLYSTFLGGSNDDIALGIALDNNGDIYLAGYTDSDNFPANPGSYDDDHNGGRDVFISKFSGDGSDLIFSTYVGGGGDEGPEHGNGTIGLSLDEEFNIFVAGPTTSQDFPTTDSAYNNDYSGGESDLFVFKLSFDGTDLDFSTYVGGDETDFPNGADIIVDSEQNVIITGSTNSSNFPTTDGILDPTHNGAYDTVVLKLVGSGTHLESSTFLGSEDNDSAISMIMDDDQNIYLTGITNSNNFPTTADAFSEDPFGESDLFLTVLNDDLSELIYSSYIGGEGDDQPASIIHDTDGNILIAGTTSSEDFPTTDGAFTETFQGGETDVFLLALDTSEGKLEFSTFIGGNGSDSLSHLFLDDEGSIYLSGSTFSTDFPITPGSLDETHDGGLADAFVMKFDGSGTNLHYSTFIGGSESDYGGPFLLDTDGNVILTGWTGSTDFPTISGAYDDTHNGKIDAYLLSFNLLTATISDISLTVALEWEEIDFSGMGSNGGVIIEYLWTSNLDGTIYSGSDANVCISNLTVGTHNITLRVKDEDGYWSESVTAISTVIVHERPQAYIDSISPTDSIQGQTVTFSGHGTDDGSVVNYSWRSSEDGLLSVDKTGEFNTTSLSNGTHTISFMVQDDLGAWSREKEMSITVNGRPIATIIAPLDISTTEGKLLQFQGTGFDDGNITNISWVSTLDDFLSDQFQFNSSLLSNGSHTITLTIQDDNGLFSEEINTTVFINGIPRATIESITPEFALENGTVTFNGSWDDDGTIEKFRWESSRDDIIDDSPFFTMTSLSNGTHKIIFSVMDNKGEWSQESIAYVTINGIPRAFISEISSIVPNENEPIYLEGGATDDGTIGSYRWESDLDGVLGDQHNLTTTLSVGNHNITFYATDNNGTESLPVIIEISVNRIPTAIIDSIQPAYAEIGEEVSFQGHGTDDSEITQYSWYSDIDGFLGDTKEIALSTLSEGNHTITFSVKDDRETWSSPATSPLQIHSNPPPELTITPIPTTALPGQIVEITVTYTGDLEDALLTITDPTGYTLWEDTISFDEQNLFLLPLTISEMAPGGTYIIDASTNDPLAAQSFFTITIPNRSPMIEDITIIPSDIPAHTESSLSVKVEATDPDDDPLAYYYAWYVNDVLQEGPNTTLLTLDGSFFKKGDIVTVSVTVQDGVTTPATGNSTNLTIFNTKPTISEIKIIPEEPSASDILSVEYQYSDKDDDGKGISLFTWSEFRAEGWKDIYHGLELPESHLRKDSIWKCKITPFDGQEYGIAIYSHTITIGNSRPIARISSPSAENTYHLGDELFFDGRSSFDLDADKLTYQWTIDDVVYNSSSFNLSHMGSGQHEIKLKVSDQLSSTTRKLIITINDPLQPELFTSDTECYFTNLESDGSGRVGKDISFTVFVWNRGEIEANATVYFYIGSLDGQVIGNKPVRVPAKGFDTAFIVWSPDTNGEFQFFAEIVPESQSGEDPLNNIAQRTISISPKKGGNQESADNSAVIIAGTISITAFGTVVATYEPWKFKFFALFVPLYTRLNHEKRMDNENRSKILGFILGMEEGKRESGGKAGVSYSTIKKKLKFSNGALAYHLSVLEREGDIRSEKVGKYRLYFPSKIIKPKTIFMERLTDLQERLIDEMRIHSEISQKKLVKLMKESQQVISYNLNRLEQKGIVHLKRRGNRSYCKLNPEYADNQTFL